MKYLFLFVAVILFTSISSQNQACPECMNNSFCNTTSGHCICPQRFKNAPEVGRFNCTVPSCRSGKGPDSQNRCSCDQGWGGLSCVQCLSDDACLKRHRELFPGPDHRNDTSYCDRSWLPHVERFYTCHVMDELTRELLGNVTGMSCSLLLEDIANGTCTFQAFTFDSLRHPNTMVQTVDCVFNNCTRKLLPGGDVRADCLRTRCRCGESDKCDDPNIRYIVDNMKTTASVECNNATKVCRVQQKEFPGEIDLTCSSSECVSEFRDYVIPERSFLFLYIVSGVGSFVFGTLFIILIIITIIDLCLSQKLTKEWNSMNTDTMGSSFEFRNITYTLKVKEKGKWVQKKILKNLSHKIKSGSVLALMGPSGAGKTTLLDILAKRNKEGIVEGEILVDGKDLKDSFQRMTGYVFQDDILMPTLTVRECLMFSANLRLPSCVSNNEKEARVQKVMEDLGISHISERLIGNESSRGISGGEKRRVSIGMELVISPHVLFLDEPTSGLDSYNAYSVIKCLVNLAKKGRTIVFSIHQPRSNIFSQFDEIILINGGDIVYSGAASNAVTHFTNLGHTFPSNTNPADFLIDILTMSPPKPSEKKVVTKVNMIDEYDYGREANNDDSISSSETYSLLMKSKTMMPYATTFLQQFLVLSKRSFFNFIRNIYLMPAHFGSSAVLGLLLGGIYWKLGINLEACQNRIGVIFFMLSVLGFSAMSSLELFVSERVIYTRERANGYYRPMAYFLSKILFDIIPLRVIPPIIIGSISYYMIGLRAGASHFFWFISILVLFNVVAGGMCLVIASIAPNVAAANVIAIACILVNTLFGGFLINKNSLPSWLSWVFYLSYWNYSFESLLINEFLGMAIIIDPKGVREYPGTGRFILDLFGMAADSFYPDIIILGCYGLFFILLSGLMITVFVKEKR